VIGALAASLVQMAPHAAPDRFTAVSLRAHRCLAPTKQSGPTIVDFRWCARGGTEQGQGVGAPSRYWQVAADLRCSKLVIETVGEWPPVTDWLAIAVISVAVP
jgi:hypothetical protein